MLVTTSFPPSAQTLDIHGEQLEEVPQRQEYPRDRYLPADVDEVIMSETRRMRAEHQDKLRKARALAAAEVGVVSPVVASCRQQDDFSCVM